MDQSKRPFLPQKPNDPYHSKFDGGHTTYNEKSRTFQQKDDKLYSQNHADIEAKKVAYAKELSEGKAKKILSENKANGHELTARQKRYMGWVAGGRK